MSKIFLSLAAGVALLFAEAEIAVSGNVVYSIDDKASTASVLKDGQTISYINGTGKIDINDKEANKRFTLGKEGNSYTAVQKASFFSGIQAVFAKSQSTQKGAFTRNSNCEVLNMKKDILVISPSIETVEIFRDNKLLREFTTLSAPNSEIKILPGDGIYLTDPNGYDTKCYTVE